MEIGVFFLGLRFQHLWPGKLWKGTGGWNGENQDVVLKLGVVGFNAFDFQWMVFSSNFCYLSFNLTFSSLEFSMARRHLCDLLLVPLELKRLSDDECFVLLWLKLCLLEATSSVFCEFFLPGSELQWDPFGWKFYMCFTDIFPLLVAYTNNRSWKNCTIRS